MTETTRTTVTLSRISMNQVKELVGVFGSTPASVISRVVEHFFDYGKFDEVIEKMKAKKRELFPPDEAILNERIKNLFKGADKIPFDDFINFLQVDKKLVLENIHIWTEKYNIKIIENLVIKNLE